MVQNRKVLNRWATWEHILIMKTLGDTKKRKHQQVLVCEPDDIWLISTFGHVLGGCECLNWE